MRLSELKLETWDLPVGCQAPLCGPIDGESEIEWFGANVAVKLRQVEVEKDHFWIFAQPQDEMANSYVVCRNYGNSLAPQIAASVKRAQTPLRCRLPPTSLAYCLSRFIHLNVPEKPVAIFSKYWNGWHYRMGRVTPFSAPADSEQSNSLFLYNWLAQEWEKPTSEVRFAWQWRQQGAETRAQFLKGVKESVQGLDEEVAQLEKIVGLIACVESQLIPDMEWSLGTKLTPSSVAVSGEAGSQNIDPDPALVTRLERWHEILTRHFPVLEILSDETPVCLRHAVEQWVWVSVPGQNASDHQRLEAVSQLRQWLRGKVSEAEAARLLPLE